jgi:hypothetical protein
MLRELCRVCQRSWAGDRVTSSVPAPLSPMCHSDVPHPAEIWGNGWADLEGSCGGSRHPQLWRIFAGRRCGAKKDKPDADPLIYTMRYASFRSFAVGFLSGSGWVWSLLRSNKLAMVGSDSRDNLFYWCNAVVPKLLQATST